MAEKGYFFNSIEGDPREYDASDFANYFNKFIPTGVFNTGQGLYVSADGTSLNTIVGTGAAFIDGYMYQNTEPKSLTHEIADPTYDRIDLVVIRLDRNYGVRDIKATIIQGTPAPNPVPPELIDDGYIKDIPLAEVRILAGQSTISQSQITDKRGNLIDAFGKVIEEYGSNANGSYIRFSNGVQICWTNFRVDFGSGVEYVWWLPATFIDNNYFASVQMYKNSADNDYAIVKGKQYTNNNATFRTVYKTGDLSGSYLYCFAIGRWK